MLLLRWYMFLCVGAVKYVNKRVICSRMCWDSAAKACATIASGLSHSACMSWSPVDKLCEPQRAIEQSRSLQYSSVAMKGRKSLQSIATAVGLGQHYRTNVLPMAPGMLYKVPNGLITCQTNNSNASKCAELAKS